MKTLNTAPLQSNTNTSKTRKPFSFKYNTKLDIKIVLTVALIATFAAVVIGFIQILSAGGIKIDNPASSSWTYSQYNQMNYLTAISLLGIVAAGLLTALKVLATPQVRKQIVAALVLLFVAVITSVGALILSSIAPSTSEVFSTWTQERYGVVVTENPDFNLVDGQIIINKVNEDKVSLHKNPDNSYSLYNGTNQIELERK